MKVIKFIALAALGLILGLNLSPLLPGVGVEQPFSFNHYVHRVMECNLCHTGARNQPKAGLADIKTCLKCHATSPLSPKNYQKVWEQAEKENLMQWNKLAKVPSHVYFSHNRHVNLAGLDCQECHGRIFLTTKLPNTTLKKISMDNCLDCHRKNKISQDCASCHR